MLAETQAIDKETHFQVAQFILTETGLLDARLLDDWIELLTPDFTYQVPIPVTPDNPSRPPWVDGSFLVEETRDSLANLWAKRYEPEFVEYAWGENPPQRIRRFVSNQRVSPGEAAGSYRVESNLLLSFARQADPVVLVPAGRVDEVVDVGGDLKLARRVVHIDQVILTLTHMRIVF